jgi:hypothetical protein
MLDLPLQRCLPFCNGLSRWVLLRVITVLFRGGPSHIDTFDPRPDAPVENRKPVKSIATDVAAAKGPQAMTRHAFLFSVCLLTLFALALPVRAETPLRQVIDTEVKAVWQRKKITPAGQCNDAAFVRRIYLDLAGTIPTLDEAQRFLKDTAADKRSKLIDRLLDDPRYAAHMADIWLPLLISRNPTHPEVQQNYPVLYRWLKDKFARNEPYDRWVRELLRGEGSSAENGPPLFYIQLNGRVEETTVLVSRIFLGTQIQCAQCHDHPLDRWTQLDFYGMAGFFARVGVADGGVARGKRRLVVFEKSTGEVFYTDPAARANPGKKGKPVSPRFLGGEALKEPELPKGFKEPLVKAGQVPPKPLFSRKEKVVEWTTAADNPYFARAIANRLWGQLMGRGLYQPVDNIRESKPAAIGPLFQALHEGLVKHQFDLKWLIRELVNSETYQLSMGKSDNADWYGQRRLRPLTAEEMLAALRVATGFDASARLSGKPEDAKLPFLLVHDVMRELGEPVDGRGEFQGSLSERLLMSNSHDLRQIIRRRKGNLMDSILTSRAPWEERVNQLYLTVLSRPPRDEERKRFVEYLTSDPKNAEPLVEEAIWALLSCSEFRFNH